ncbi:MAG: cell wall hydrolase [Lachnospiraceae bacterium]|nr:cell wall hydrolase [Lachnospiraceae bacterium]
MGTVKKQKRGAKLKIAFLVTAALVSSVPSPCYASSSTRQEIEAAEQEKGELEDQRDANQQELDDLRGEQNSLKRQLTILNEQLTAVSDRLADLEQQIRDKEQEITETTQALEEARATEAWQYDCMEKRIQYAYERGQESLFEIFFSWQNLARLLNASVYTERIAEADDDMLDQIIANRDYIESEEARLQQEKEELDYLRVEAEAEKSRVSGLISQTSSGIADYADQISDAEQQALEYEESIKKLEEDLEYLKKKLAQEIAMSQQAANATWRDISDVTFAEDDRYLLANLIYCEAGGEPYDGKLAVGAVVINRVLSSVYPDTVVGVIYQSNQFSPVRSGRLELALASNKATADCYRAAEEAMSGMSNVGNCVYFRTPVEGLTGISIGGHIFY